VRSRLLLAVLLAGLTLLAVPPAQSETLPAGGATPQLRRDGPWSVDGAGRVVLLHGVNAVWKLTPYTPPETAEGFIAQDADFLARNGFNAVRIGILFSGVMPQPGVIDQGYLDAWQRVIDLLAARHIWVMIDFHQDLFTERFQGEGFPAWAVHQPLTSALPDPAFGFPANYFTPQVSEVFDQLYANAGGVRDKVAQAWAAVAERFRHQPYLMGYDLINEPWPGTDFATCANPFVCPGDATELAGYLDALRRAIRTKDRSNIVWYEPNVLFDFGAGSGLPGPVDDPQLGLSWHNYCLPAALLHAQGLSDLPGCEDLEGLVFDNARSLAARLGATQVLSEFGASDDLADIALVTQQADDNLVGWQYWHYKLWRDPTTESQTSGAQGLFVKDDDLRTLKPEKADLLIRSYPMATAGTPRDLDYDPVSGELTYTYSPGRGGLTDVFISPRRLLNGYRADVTGGRVVSPPGARILQVAAAAGATTTTIHVYGGRASGTAPPAKPSDGHGPLAATGLASTLVLFGGLTLILGLLARRWRTRPPEQIRRSAGRVLAPTVVTTNRRRSM
jgi:endoglycosylceramidase